MVYKKGIHIESEFEMFQEKARKWDALLNLRKEEKQIKERIRQIGQERFNIVPKKSTSLTPQS